MSSYKEGITLCIGGSDSCLRLQVLGNLIGVLIAILYTLAEGHACHVIASQQDAAIPSACQILLCSLQDGLSCSQTD